MYKNYRVIYGFSSILFLLLICSAFQGCKPIPIQLARTIQIDFYTQYYEFEKNIPDTTDRITLVTELMGAETLGLFFDEFNEMTNDRFISEADKGNIFVKGALSIVVYLNPVESNETFFVDGIGRYALIYHNNDKQEILFSADFWIKNNRHSIEEDLRKNRMLKVNISQMLTRHFGYFKKVTDNETHKETIEKEQKNYLNELNNKLSFNIQMEDPYGNNEVFRIKYFDENGKVAKHRVFWENTEIGFLKFDSLAYNEYKLIDLRGRSYIKSKSYRPK